MTLMFMSISLVKELPVFKQNTEFTNKTRQNIAHQHIEAAVRGAIVDVWITYCVCQLASMYIVWIEHQCCLDWTVLR